MKQFGILAVAVTVLLVGGVWLSNSLSANDPNVISHDGIHWHPELEIYVKGERQTIPENMGLVGVHSPIHTHEDLPIIHLEFSGIVRESDIKLGNLFRVWGKDFMEFGSKVTLIVNGEEITDPPAGGEDYIMRHEDKIELHYE